MARDVGSNLVSKWGPSAKMYELLPVSWARSGVLALGYTISCRCPGSKWGPSIKMYDLLSVLWARRCVRVPRCTICCGCLGLEQGHSAKIFDLLPVSWLEVAGVVGSNRVLVPR